MKTAEIAIKGWIDKQIAVYTKNGILFIYKKGMKYWDTLQHGWTSNILGWVKEARPRGHLLHEIYRIVNPQI